MNWLNLAVAFMLGMFVATMISDQLYRWWRREADSLIKVQREYIAVLEARGEP